MDFKKSHFYQDVEFDCCYFSALDFGQITCEGHLILHGAQSLEGKEQCSVEFNRGDLSYLSITECEFSELHLISNRINGKFTFQYNEVTMSFVFESNEITQSTELDGDAIKFLNYKSHIGERVVFHGVKTIEGGIWSFNNQDCGRLQFLSCDLSNADFLGANLRDTSFDSCKWELSRNYAQVFGHDQIITSNDPEELENLRSLYLRLKKNHDENHEYALSGDFHYLEMSLKRKLLRGQGGIKNNLEKFILDIYKLVADYGESPFRLGMSLITSLVGTALAIGVFNKIALWNKVNLINYSLDHFWSNLGMLLYGLVPSAMSKPAIDKAAALSEGAKFLVFAEAIFAISITTLLIMAIRRRFKR